jgi:hypothetical protein
MVLHLIHVRKTGKNGSLMIIYAILFAISAGFIFSLQLSFGSWFNHLDISHVLLAVFTLFIFKGAFELATENTVESKSA